MGMPDYATRVRDQAMLMMQPIGAVAYLALLAVEKKDLREKAREAAPTFLVLAGIFLLGWSANKIAYADADWLEYIRFNDANTVIFDYTGAPAYEEVKDILDRYGVTETEYAAFANFVILGDDISADCAEEIAAYASKTRGAGMDFGTALAGAWNARFHDDFQGMNRFANLIFAAGVLLMLIARQFRMLVPMGSMIFASNAVWIYLYLKGRTPFRVTAPLFAAEAIGILALTLVGLRECDNLRKRRLLLGALCLTTVWMGMQSGKTQYRYLVSQKDGQEAYIKGLYEISDYCRSHPANRYLIGNVTYSFYAGGALDLQVYEPRNSYVTGTWIANSPVTNAYLEDYFADCDSIYLIVYAGETRFDEAAISYLSEKTGTEGALADAFTVSHGGRYEVYYFGGDTEDIFGYHRK